MHLWRAVFKNTILFEILLCNVSLSNSSVISGVCCHWLLLLQSTFSESEMMTWCAMAQCVTVFWWGMEDKCLRGLF